MSKPDVTNAVVLFKEYTAAASESHERAMQLMGKCIHAYTLMPSRWSFLTSLQSFKASDCHQEYSSTPALPHSLSLSCDRRAAVDAYFEDLYAAAAASDIHFHETFEQAMAEFNRAERPEEIDLAPEEFPFMLHRAGKPEVRRGPLKAKKRAQEKVETKLGSETAWPPRASEVLDLVRTTALFEDAYQLVAFLAHLKKRITVVRVKNQFEGFDVADPARFRNVNTNVAFNHGGRRVVVEAQLHLKALYTAQETNHAAYEVIRAVEPSEVCGPLVKWTRTVWEEHSTRTV
jgi:hypothetical protein